VTLANHCENVDHLGSDEKAELLGVTVNGVSSGFKLFAYVILVVCSGLRVKPKLFNSGAWFHVQYWSILNCRNLRSRCGSVAVAVNFSITYVQYCSNILAHSLSRGNKHTF